MLEAGEQSGSLEPILEAVAGFLEEQQGLRERVLTALIYPLVVVALCAVLAAGVLLYMLPMLESMLSESGMSVPPACPRDRTWISG